MNRAEHVDWAKRRALEYVEAGHGFLAVASIASDLSKHPETANHPGIIIGILTVPAENLHELKRWIEGFA